MDYTLRDDLMLEDYERKQIVVFQLADEEYAVDISQSKQIIKVSKITPVPNTPDYVRGVINLRGQIVPVIDLRKRFGITGTVEKERIITIEFDDILIGILVDEIKEVLWYDVEKELESAPDIDSSIRQDYIKGVVKKGKRLIVLIDLEKLLFENRPVSA
ncbi:MAG TPA: chemotaxis protein CheW [Halanaerobiaceae bacterium]|jgi:purine-binding chemotaxis protein CheW|nr:chemotaxis protein CheW [Bacillota bacterium]HHU91712.1 chemotaxis protein CheW [Halanaerobiaceae bacterium]HOA40407.1 chemotaxis protein CheW [Halanaerobiales bacterium]HPZ62553.1 chemotaxis protein CheW [Halanaerobiales bacterium]HQD03151.1 chemotaxis protein CheW [Halanaerobiales bacterium]